MLLDIPLDFFARGLGGAGASAFQHEVQVLSADAQFACCRDDAPVALFSDIAFSGDCNYHAHRITTGFLLGQH